MRDQGNHNEISIQGTVVEIIYENEDNGYKICDVIYDGGTVVTVRGTLPFLYLGEFVTLEGYFSHHKVYGEQFIVTTYSKNLPDNVEDLEIFLASGLIEGVGPATAKAIIRKFGTDTVRVILTSPEQLETVRGITYKRAIRIAETFQQYEQMRELTVFFNKYGISTALALKVYRKYGGLALEIVQKNPYRLIEDIPEVGFKTADRIGISVGIGIDSSSRICAGILHVLAAGVGNGHVYIPEDQLRKETSFLLDVDEKYIESALDTLVSLGKVTCVGTQIPRRIFLSYMYGCESYIAMRLCQLKENRMPIRKQHYEKHLKQFEEQTGLLLDDAQRSAILQSAECGFSIITGGPGTGKTTIIKALVHLLSGDKRKCVLAAPTGRAAKRMSEACGLPAKTIHRLLEFYAAASGEEMRQEGDYLSKEDYRLEFGKNETNPIDANVLIIDESSMIDTILLYHLLKAVPNDAQLIFVGDKDQLPSVGPGKVLKDIIQTHVFPTTVLYTIYRQKTQSMIAYNASRINHGEMPEFNYIERDFFLLPRNTPTDVMKTMLDVVCRRLPQAYHIDPMQDIQVLIPNKKGICGVIHANSLLQQALNPPGEMKKEYTNGAGIIFREGDRVMQIKNNYEIVWHKQDTPGVEGKGIFNGEMGVILSVDNPNKEITILFDEERIALYDFSSMHQIEHCFAITVHKSQGSEFDYCVIPFVQGPPMLMTRNVLYTAVTRGRKMVIMIGSNGGIETMVLNNTEQMRYTNLTEQIMERSKSE